MRSAVRVVFGVLGPVAAWDDAGDAIALKGPRHRAVLARLVIARGRVVPVSRLVEDRWTDPPTGAVGAVRTFVAALRRALEPGRPPRAPARLLVTDGPGYALRAEPDAVDAWRFDRAVTAAATTAATSAPGEALARLDVPEPPRDLMLEALWCLTARAAVAVGDRETMERAHAELSPAAGELAGAGTGLLTLGPVSAHLTALTTALHHPPHGCG